MAASADPAALQAHVAQLPVDIQRVAADYMRLATGYGRDAGARKFEQFCDASRGNQDAILGGISK